MTYYHASDTIRAPIYDGSYLSEPKSKDKTAGHFYLTNKDTHYLNNGAILTLTKIMKHVIGSSGQIEVASLYYNSKNTISLRRALEEMGHP